eukprot:CAMPEP_0113679336 /NCGR_PEP_ID=MMETSP0038_2-20120614/10567_1 /TAXON_ID=2898 /ORGANISM="Cryptomonas paramecium" /LENGTH=93 /DNA_ID=CAMNT_0000597315 /DNA_START=956 /DNA_END=1237 /DNA_ORIENTATION=+ /assembly_acc=CAM_ASM_000170
MAPATNESTLGFGEEADVGVIVPPQIRGFTQPASTIPDVPNGLGRHPVLSAQCHAGRVVVPERVAILDVENAARLLSAQSFPHTGARRGFVFD